jgi:hypothetical protein
MGDYLLSASFWYGVLIFRLRLPFAGDVHRDGVADFGDIYPFVLALTNPSGYLAQFPDRSIENGDLSYDGLLDSQNINPFVALFTGK